MAKDTVQTQADAVGIDLPALLALLAKFPAALLLLKQLIDFTIRRDFP